MDWTGTVAAATFPITSAGHVLGSITASVTERPERLTDSPDLAARLRGLAGQAWTALNNATLLDQVRRQALHDGLTDLPNRALILDRAEQMLARAARDHRACAAFFIDLDNFKTVNDTLGHAAGDELLKAVAERLTAAVRANDTVGRLGGDEFVVLAEGDLARRRSRARRGAAARRAGHALRAGRLQRHAVDDLREHRDRHRQAHQRRRAAPRRRHRAVPGEGPWQGVRGRVRVAHAVRGARPARARGRPPDEPVRGVRARVPADPRPADAGDDRRRGAAPLAAPRARHRDARRLHPDPRGHRDDPARRRSGCSERRALRARAGTGPVEPIDHLGERLHATARERRPPRGRPQRPRRSAASLPAHSCSRSRRPR